MAGHSSRDVLVRGVAALVSTIVVASPAAALDPQRKISDYSLDYWLPEHGLPQASVQAIAQSSDGYLWLGTQEGLARFDGIRFEVFDSRTTPVLTGNQIPSIVEHDGSVWFTPHGDGVARHTAGEIVVLPVDAAAVTERARELISGGDDGLWMLTPCCVVRYRDGAFESFPYREDLDGDVAATLLRATDGTMWLGTRAGGIARLDGDRFEYVIPPSDLDAGIVTAMMQARGGALWFGTRSGGAFTYLDGQLVRHPDVPDYVTALAEDDHGTVWIGTFNHGLCRLHDGTTSCLGTTGGMPDDTVIALLQDHEGSLWVGTHGAGLVRLRDSTFTSLTTVDGLVSDGVWSIAAGQDGVWVNSDPGMALVTQAGVESVPLPDDKSGMSVFEDRQGCTWIGWEGAGLARLCDGRWTTYDPEDGGPERTIFAIAQDTDGTMWFGTDDGLYHLAGGRFQRFDKEDGLPGTHVRALHVDGQGVLWVGLYGNGLAVRADRGFERFDPGVELTGGQMATCDIHRSADQTLWIGTVGGLLRIRDGAIAVFTTSDGLFDDLVYGIAEDDEGHLWMSCNRGISRVDTRQLDAVSRGELERVEPAVFGVGDGMPAVECSGGAESSAIRTGDGRLWFPTIGGVAVADPSEIRFNDVPPPVQIERVFVENEPVSVRGPLELRAGTRHLQLHFTALSFIDPGRIRFRYLLENYDDDWIDAGALRVAQYTGLPPGDYTFRVIACNSDGVWNHEGASLAVRKLPYFHQTTAFWVLCGLLLLGTFAGIYSWRLRRLKKRQQELEVLVEQRSRQLVEAENLLAEARHLPIRFGPYVLLSILGEGGMARVYRAVREGPMGFRKELAIKRIRSDLTKANDDLVRSMINEARLGGQLKHPNVVDTYEFGSVDDQYYIAMEYVDGWTLRELIDGARLREVRLPPGAVLDLALQICAGLAYAHGCTSSEGQRLNLVHRDLKPANVIVSVAGVAKIMDFGIARSETAAFNTTRSHVVKGTPRFMSPEQLQAPQTIDSRSDLFAFGGLLFRALTGENLLSGPSMEALMWQIVSGTFTSRLAILDTVLPAALPVLRRCLADDREDRYPSAEELAVDLRRLQQEFGDPLGCTDLAELIRAHAEGDRARLAVLRTRIAEQAPGRDAWLEFADALHRVDADDPDPYRRRVQSALPGDTTATEVERPSAAEDGSTVAWRDGDFLSFGDE